MTTRGKVAINTSVSASPATRTTPSSTLAWHDRPLPEAPCVFCHEVGRLARSCRSREESGQLPQPRSIAAAAQTGRIEGDARSTGSSLRSNSTHRLPPSKDGENSRLAAVGARLFESSARQDAYTFQDAAGKPVKIAVRRSVTSFRDDAATANTATRIRNAGLTRCRARRTLSRRTPRL